MFVCLRLEQPTLSSFFKKNAEKTTEKPVKSVVKGDPVEVPKTSTDSKKEQAIESSTKKRKIQTKEESEKVSNEFDYDDFDDVEPKQQGILHKLHLLNLDQQGSD